MIDPKKTREAMAWFYVQQDTDHEVESCFCEQCQKKRKAVKDYTQTGDFTAFAGLPTSSLFGPPTNQ